jgi:hypothetical protein
VPRPDAAHIYQVPVSCGSVYTEARESRSHVADVQTAMTAQTALSSVGYSASTTVTHGRP